MLQSNSNIPNMVAQAVGQHPSENNDKFMSPPLVLQYLQVITRWKWVIAGIIAAAFTIGLVATLLMTPLYTAKSRIEISREQKNITNVDGLESREAGRDLEFYQTQYSLLEARSLAERVAKQLRLATSDAFFEAHGMDTADGSGLFGKKSSAITGEQRLKREKLVVDALLANIGINPIRGSALIDINYTSASPKLSADISNAWTQQFVESSMDRRFASTSDARRFLEARLADLRARLEQSERELVNYASQKGIISLWVRTARRRPKELWSVLILKR
jgi:polysaccharide biosynthesis transport protein